MNIDYENPIELSKLAYTLLTARATSPVIGYDTETYYDDRCNANLGIYKYTTHEDFEIICSALSRPFSCVGVYETVPDLRGLSICSHNAIFDIYVHFAVIRAGITSPDNLPNSWHCTASISAYSLKVRSLKDAVRHAFGVDISKQARTDSKGMTRSQLVRAGKMDSFEKYCSSDAMYTARLYSALNSRFGEIDRCISADMSAQSALGFVCDYRLATRMYNALSKEKRGIESTIPWTPIQSKTSMNRYFGCDVSKLTAGEVSDIGDDYLTAHTNYSRYLSVKRLCGSVKSVINNSYVYGDRIYSTAETVYMGASKTGRHSGRGGLNIMCQDTSAGTYCGIVCNTRHLILPREGYRVISCDLKHIEPTTLLYCLNVNLGSACSRYGVYEAYARELGEYNLDEQLRGKPEYKLYKTEFLSLMYGSGAIALAERMLEQGIEIDIDDDFNTYSNWKAYQRNQSAVLQCEKMIGIGRLTTLVKRVNKFREKIPQIRQASGILNACIETAYESGKSLMLDLPSGRVLEYKRLRKDGETYYGTVGDEEFRIYGGLLLQHYTQATAADIFKFCRYNLLRNIPEVRCIYDEHDKAVLEIPAVIDVGSVVEQFKAPDWLPGLSISVEVVEQ